MNYLEVAVIAAKEAGKIHLKHFNTGVKFETKSSVFDLVTVADIESEKKIVSIIKENYPQHNILAEEEKYDETPSEYRWVIDPLDGTNNFASGLPIFCVSIALVKNTEILLGVIYDATRDELFYAEKNKGAFLNGKPINVSPESDLENSILITGFYYDRGENMQETLDNIKDFFIKGIRGLRRLGAAALDLCYIASGRSTGFWEFVLSPWDYAAGKIIIEEAGGRVTGKGGEKISPLKSSYIVASNGKIHKDILSVIKKP